MENKYSIIKKRYLQLYNEAQNWVPAWKDLSQYMKPSRGFFVGDTPNSGKKIDHQKITKSTPAIALRTLGAGMTSGLTSPSRPWFKLGLPDKDLEQFKPVKLWLSQVRDIMLNIYSKSNIYGVLTNIYEEIAQFGTACALITEDTQEIIRGRNYTCGEYMLACNASGRVDTFARSYNMTVMQIVKEFGLENCSAHVQSLYKQNQLETFIKVCHLIEPNDDRIVGMVDNKNMPYRSIYWEDGSLEDESCLRKSGFMEFPILAPRWSITTTADVYGRSPAWDGLGDVKMLYKLVKDRAHTIEKMYNPPIQVSGNTLGELNMLAGGVSRFDATTGPNAGVKTAYEVRPDLQGLQLIINEAKADIDALFYADLFLMLARQDRPQMTAREIVERHEEKLLQLGPVLESLESELLDPLVDLTFANALRMGALPLPPKELQGISLEVEYISLLSQAQKMVGTTAVEQAVSFAGNMAGVFPDVLDNINSDKVITEYADMLGVPAEMVRSRDEVDQIRQAKQQAAEAAQANQQAQESIAGAKVLSETKVGENSALDALLSGASGAVG